MIIMAFRGHGRDLRLYHLPTEILVSILSRFETQSLLPLIVVSRQFHSIILRIIHFRLLLAAALPDYKLILEAYRPSKRYADPYLFCTYLGTDGLSSKHEGVGSLYEDCRGEEGRFAKLGALYSRFRPERPGVQGLMPLRRIAGSPVVRQQHQEQPPPPQQQAQYQQQHYQQLPFQQQQPPQQQEQHPSQEASSSSSAQQQQQQQQQPIYGTDGDQGLEKVVHNLYLDADELFCQFCAYASLVRLGPHRGVFLSNVHIVQPGQGVMRVWKQWLQDRAQELWLSEGKGERERDLSSQSFSASSSSSSSSTSSTSSSSPNNCPNIGLDKNILWTDYRKNVGLRVAIRDRDGKCCTRGPPSEEYQDTPMSFVIEIQELVVRTTHLMLAVETSSSQAGDGKTGKALIFGRFASPGPAAPATILAPAPALWVGGT
ncbi:uncharacterized protein PV06_00577 [Exophiala oligosperma]|uniref:F-box domain-containing protein n=2 Tax=Chaetothyriales TaxID=34395 RepID=A0A0D2DXW9_9EURO|nr:uncharacterized protein PV06_00577 [Exophiala oligosperma]KIW47928.1 hypothetical protein PV06_00577 [Exophiala oligosperma]